MRHRWVVLALSLAALIGAGLGWRSLELDTNSASLISGEDPVSNAYRENLRLFGEANPMIVRLRIPEGARGAADQFSELFVEAVGGWEDVETVAMNALGEMEGSDAREVFRVVLRNADGETVSRFAGRFEAEELEREVRRTRKKLIMADDAELRELLMQDPLNLREFVFEFFDKRIGFQEFSEETRYVESDDGAVRLLFLYPQGSAEDSRYCRDLVSRLEELAERLRGEVPGAEGIETGYTGVHAMTGETGAYLGEDMGVITLTALAGIVAVLWFAFRRLVRGLLCAAPLVISMAVVFLLALVLFSPINYITIGFVAIVMGLGLDVSLHLTARYFQLRGGVETGEAAVELAFKDCGMPITVGILSSAAAFLSLLFSGSPGLVQFGLLTALGLVVTLLVTMFVFPATVAFLDPLLGDTKDASLRLLPGSFFELGARHSRGVLRVGGGVILLGIFFAREFEFDMDLMQLTPTGMESTLLAEDLADSFGANFGAMTQATIEAGGFEEAMAAQRRLDARLEEFVREGKVAAFWSPGAHFVYGGHGKSGEGDEWEKIREKVVAGRSVFLSAAGKAGFREDGEFKDYYEQVLDSVGEEKGAVVIPPSSAPERGERYRLVSLEEGRYRLLTQIVPSARGDLIPEAQQKQVLALTDSLRQIDVSPGVSLEVTGALHVYEKVNASLRDDFFRVSWIGVVAVIVVVLLFFRSLQATVFGLVPVVGGLVSTLGFIVLLGIPFTPTCVSVAAVIVGVGIDNAIHIIARLHRDPIRRLEDILHEVGPVITLTTVSTFIGFGALALSRLPAVASLGEVIAVGVVQAWLFSLWVLPALLMLKRMLSMKRNWRGGGSAAARLFFAAGLFFSAGACGVAGIAWAEDVRIERLREKMQKQYDETEAVSCSFSQTKRVSQLAGEIKLKGTLQFQKPSLFKVEIEGDENLALWCDGSKVWFVDRDLDEVSEYGFKGYQTEMQFAGIFPPFIFSDHEEVERTFEIGYERDPRRTRVERLTMRPRHPVASKYRLVQVEVDGVGQLLESRVELSNGDLIVTKYRSWKRPEKAPVSAFRYPGE